MPGLLAARLFALCAATIVLATPVRAKERAGANAAVRAPASRTLSPCGRHVVEVTMLGVRVDGQRVANAKQRRQHIEVLVGPTWRRDGEAVAWVERTGKQRRLVVVPVLGRALHSLSWALPALGGHDRIFWAAGNKVTVGVGALQPRAVASW